MSRYCRLPRKEVRSQPDMTGRSCVRLNGSAPERPDAPLPFYPGRRNTLEVRAARQAPDAQVRMRATTPDRRAFTRTRRLPSGGSVELDLGPLLVPAAYEFEAGVCYRRGYRFTIAMHDPGYRHAVLGRCELYQCCSGDEHAEWVRLGDRERVVYDTGWVPPGRHWNPFSEMSRSMQPAVELRLGPRVLLDRDSVELRYRLRPGLAGVDELRARLAVHRRRRAAHAWSPARFAIGPEWSARRGRRVHVEAGDVLVRAAAGAGRPALRAGAAAALPASCRPTLTACWCHHWPRFGCGGTEAAPRWRSTTGSGLPRAARGASRARGRIRAWSAERRGARSRCNWGCGAAMRCSCRRSAVSTCRLATD